MNTCERYFYSFPTCTTWNGCGSEEVKKNPLEFIMHTQKNRFRQCISTPWLIFFERMFTSMNTLFSIENSTRNKKTHIHTYNIWSKRCVISLEALWNFISINISTPWILTTVLQKWRINNTLIRYEDMRTLNQDSKNGF